jgi:RNA polymerase sigma-70 factor (ECF subfamily)
MSEPAVETPLPNFESAEDSRSGARRIERPEPDQLERIYREYDQFVWRNLLRLGVPRSMAEDAVHDCFLVLAKRLGEFEGRSSIKTWLFAIVFNVARGIRRDLGRAIERQQPLDSVSEPPSDVGSPETVSDASMQLHRLLARLDEAKRAVFVMSELEQMTALEIGAVLNVKVPTVYSRLRLAKQQLQAALVEMEEGP